MDPKKYRTIIILKDGTQIFPIVEAVGISQARAIIRAQYPDSRVVSISEMR